MIRDTCFNFFCLESFDASFDTFEAQCNPHLDLSLSLISHSVLNGTFALQGHLNQWRSPKKISELTCDIAFPIFVGLSAISLTNYFYFKGRSLKVGMRDFIFHI